MKAQGFTLEAASHAGGAGTTSDGQVNPVAMTSFRDACAQPGLSLPEIARVVDRSVTRAAGDEDFVTALFAELDPRAERPFWCGGGRPAR